MRRGPSPSQTSQTQAREGYRMAGVEAPKGQGAPLIRTKEGTGKYVSSCVLHAA